MILTRSYEYRYGKWMPVERRDIAFRQLERFGSVNGFFQSSLADVAASRPIETLPEEVFRGGYDVRRR